MTRGNTKIGFAIGCAAGLLTLGLVLETAAAPPAAPDPQPAPVAPGAAPLRQPPPPESPPKAPEQAAGGKTEPPAPAKVKVLKIEISGNTLIPTVELDAIVAPRVGLESTLEELRAIPDAIAAEYVKRGYPNVKAYLPPQEIQAGVVRVAILEGKVGEIQVEGNKHYSTEFIRSRLDAAMKSGPFDSQALEAALLTLNEYPDLKVNTVLRAGKTAGTTDMVAHVEDSRPLHLTLDYNDFGSELVSRHRFGAQIDYTNLIFDGATFLARGVIGDDPNAFTYGHFSYGVPIGLQGTTLKSDVWLGDFDIGGEFRDLDVHGEQFGASLAVIHPCIRTRFMSLTAEVGLEGKDVDQFFLGESSSEDKIRMLKAGATFSYVDSCGKTFASLYLYQGLGETLGGMAENDRLASRPGADNGFTKAVLSVARIQTIDETFSALLRGSAQLSSDTVVGAEEFQVGGADTVRGYPQGEVAGDQGYAFSLELRAAPLDDKSLLQVVAFLDHGGVSVRSPLIGQDKTRYLTGAGFGFRMGLPYNADIRLDLGWPLDPDDNSNDEDPVVYASSSIRF
ncbi:MAG: ShlB/FhaC/HecB family hemolysin secretion/activation protein [Planctomycetes bacterium]|nr:ShlB/FhaC/HecB family hemolysin secretion/activation protein [Planctomycetota bacterium]